MLGILSGKSTVRSDSTFKGTTSMRYLSTQVPPTRGEIFHVHLVSLLNGQEADRIWKNLNHADSLHDQKTRMIRNAVFGRVIHTPQHVGVHRNASDK